jgi:MFS family permease
LFVLVATVSFVATPNCVVLIREPAAPPGPPANPLGARAYLKGLARERNAVRLVLFAAEELAVAEARSFLLPLVFSVVATAVMLPMGMLGDHFGRKRILTGMIAAWAVLGVLLGLARNLPEALAAIALSGVPFAAVMAVGYAFFLDLIPAERTAEFVGIGVLTAAGALFLGPLVGGQLIDTLGYRSLFPVAAAFQVVGVVLLQRVEPAAASREA